MIDCSSLLLILSYITKAYYQLTFIPETPLIKYFTLRTENVFEGKVYSILFLIVKNAKSSINNVFRLLVHVYAPYDCLPASDVKFDPCFLCVDAV